MSGASSGVSHVSTGATLGAAIPGPRRVNRPLEGDAGTSIGAALMFQTHPEERQGSRAVVLPSLRTRLLWQLFEWTGWNHRRTVVGTSLAIGDLAAAMLATSIADTLFEHGPFAAGAETIGAAFLPLYLVSSYAAGVYRGGGTSPVERVRARSLAIAWCAAAEIVICVIANRLAVDVVYTAARAMLLLVLGHLAESHVRRMLTDRGLWAAPALVVGSAANGARIRDMLVRHPGLGLRVVGVVPDKLPAGDPAASATLPQSVGFADLAARECEALVLSLPCERPFARILEFELRALRVVACGEKATPHDLIFAQPPLHGARDAQRRHPDRPPSMRWLIKRAFDLAVAVPAAVLALPVLALVIAAVKLIDPGPALYIQQRAGRGGRSFPVYKVRSMYCDAEKRLAEQLKKSPEQTTEWARFFKLKKDPRILPWIGAFIRRTSVDELPQLWNIIRGDMSVVGPRPFPEYHLQRFDDEFRRIRLSVVPGLTGLWQVMARSDGDLAVQKTLDTYYVNSWLVWLELYILLETLPAVLSGRGAR
jgi:lipopolysaccharide/colanic/teichoic acid biosynthesis glycosyltransferase